MAYPFGTYDQIFVPEFNAGAIETAACVTFRDEYLIRAIRNGLDAAGVPVEFSKGEAGKGQHEINLAYATATEMADTQE